MESSIVQPVNREKIWHLLILMRPANVITAQADIVAGWAVAGATEPAHLTALLFATTGLYSGGVVLNDVFDAKLDSVERPERPIPSGVISVSLAAWLSGTCLAEVCWPLFSVRLLAVSSRSPLPRWRSCITLSGNNTAFWLPSNMGLCRGLNLLLGLTSLSSIPLTRVPLALVTLCYTTGITALSRGEVRGGTRTAAAISSGWFALGLATLIFLFTRDESRVLLAAPLFALLLPRLSKAFWQAFRSLKPGPIRNAVRMGVLSLIFLDAGLAALCGPIWCGPAVLLLYIPDIPAMLLGRLFAVT